jgi:nicotinamidase-related amidase
LPESNPVTTALVLIDLQNDYFPGGAMELAGAEAAVAGAARLLESFHNRSLPIIHVRHESTRPGAMFFIPGTPGAEIHRRVRPLPDERVITKHFPNSFRETSLLADLQSLGAGRILFAGMMTHMCVDATVRAARDLGFDCALAQDVCATRALEFAGRRVEAEAVQVAYLAALNGLFAAVRTTQELCAEL